MQVCPAIDFLLASLDEPGAGITTPGEIQGADGQDGVLTGADITQRGGRFDEISTPWRISVISFLNEPFQRQLLSRKI